MCLLLLPLTLMEGIVEHRRSCLPLESREGAASFFTFYLENREVEVLGFFSVFKNGGWEGKGCCAGPFPSSFYSTWNEGKPQPDPPNTTSSGDFGSNWRHESGGYGPGAPPRRTSPS